MGGNGNGWMTHLIPGGSDMGLAGRDRAVAGDNSGGRKKESELGSEASWPGRRRPGGREGRQKGRKEGSFIVAAAAAPPKNKTLNGRVGSLTRSHVPSEVPLLLRAVRRPLL